MTFYDGGDGSVEYWTVTNKSRAVDETSAAGGAGEKEKENGRIHPTSETSAIFFGHFTTIIILTLVKTQKNLLVNKS